MLEPTSEVKSWGQGVFPRLDSGHSDGHGNEGQLRSESDEKLHRTITENSDDQDSYNQPKQEGIYIVIHKENPAEKMRLNWLGYPIKVLTILQIIGGLLAISLQILADSVETSLYRIASTEEGIWVGLLYLATGIVGLVSAVKVSQGLVIAYMVMNIFTAMFSVYQLFWACAIIQTNSVFSVRFVCYTLQLIIALSQGVITVTGSSLACSAVCCKGSARGSRQLTSRTILILSIIQVVLGSCIILIFLISVGIHRKTTIFFEEVWCGSFFIIAGSIGWYMSHKHSVNSALTPFLVLNIIGSLFSTMLLIFFIVQITITRYSHDRQYYYDQSDLDYHSNNRNCTESAYISLRNYSIEETEDVIDPTALDEKIASCEKNRVKTIQELSNSLEARKGGWGQAAAIPIVGLILVFAQLMVGLTSGGLGCRAQCGCCKCCSCMDEPATLSTAVFVPKKELADGVDVVHVHQSQTAVSTGQDNQHNQLNSSKYKTLREEID